MASVISAPHFHNEEAAYAFVEQRLWPEGPVCPHCGATEEHIGRLTGKSTRIGVRKCYACRKPFTVKVGTIFESSHVKLHVWLQAMHLMASSKKGVSTNQLHRILGVSLQTAWFLSHRIREAMAPHDGSEPMGGHGVTVEADEAYVGGLEKNKHRNNRAINPKGKGGKEIVLSLVERNGRVRSHHVPDVSAATLRPILFQQLKGGTVLMTDEGPSSRAVRPDFRRHEMVNHSIGEYVRGDAHTNTIEGYFSILKRGIVGTYHHVSQQHLKRYLAEFDFRYNERKALGVSDEQRADKIIRGVKGKRLTYATTSGTRAEA